MRCWKSRWLDPLLVALCAFWVGVAQAESIALRDINFGLVDDAYELNLNADFDLAPHLEQMLERGVTLTFRVEFEVFRPRWYWLDERVVRRNLNFRLSYQELTRQYRVSSGDFQQSFPSLRLALRRLSGVRHWHIGDARSLSLGTSYEARLRYFLDTSQLPKPLQLSAFTSSEWDLASDTLSWQFVASPLEAGAK
jgi:Domain of unknown function (DUF4390)